MKLPRIYGLKCASAVIGSAVVLAAGADAADAITLRQGTSTQRPTATSPAMASGATIFGTTTAYVYKNNSVVCSSSQGSTSMKVGTNPAPTIQITLQAMSLPGCDLTLRAPVTGTLSLPTPTASRAPLTFPGIEFVSGSAGAQCVVTPTFDPPASGALRGGFWNQNYANSPFVPTFEAGVRLRSTTSTACTNKFASLDLSIAASPLRSVGPPRGGTLYDGPLVGVFG